MKKVFLETAKKGNGITVHTIGDRAVQFPFRSWAWAIATISRKADEDMKV